MHTFLKLIAGGLSLYVLFCTLLFLLQRQVLFPRRMITSPDPDRMFSPGIEKTWVTTRNEKVEAWFLPPTDPSAKTPFPAVIFGHGNGELIDFWPEELATFCRWGIGVLLVEYPGYGRSPGSPSQAGISATFAQAFDDLAARKDVDAKKIILLGRSLGGGAVCSIANRKPAAAMILMSTFTSVRFFARRYLAPGFLMRDPFDNLAAVREFSEPLLILHGRNDEIIPFAHAQALSQAAGHANLIAYDCGHNDCPPDWDAFWQDVRDFLTSAGLFPKG